MNMRIHSWYVTLGILGASAAAVGACTVTSTSNPGDDGGLADDAATTEPDAGDAGTTAPTPDTGTVVSEAGDAGVACEVPDSGDSCDICALSNCCTAENQCQNVEATGDGGTTDCEDIFSCVQDCVAPPADSGIDAGDTLDNCTTTCSASHTTLGIADFSALSSCLVTMCASQCQ